MKKIVALVLSLVMVLGLATTAFAATTSTGSVSTTSVTPVKAAGYQLATAGTSMTEIDVDITTIEKTTVTGKVTDDVPMYVPTIWALNGDFFVEVAKADAKYALKNNGAYVYLYAANANTVDGVIAEFATPDVVTSIFVPAEYDADCGDAIDATTKAVVPYYTIDGVNYTQGGQNMAYFNGEFVFYGAKVDYVKHTWDKDSVIVKDTDVKGVKVPVSIECSACEKTFAVVSADQFDNTWVKFVNYDTNAAVKDYFIVLDGATDANTPAAPEASDKVESAQTFDAGIAMYVGMSVMAAAGSAVVLKKKD